MSEPLWRLEGEAQMNAFPVLLDLPPEMKIRFLSRTESRRLSIISRYALARLGLWPRGWHRCYGRALHRARRRRGLHV